MLPHALSLSLQALSLQAAQIVICSAISQEHGSIMQTHAAQINAANPIMTTTNAPASPTVAYVPAATMLEA